MKIQLFLFLFLTYPLLNAKYTVKTTTGVQYGQASSPSYSKSSFYGTNINVDTGVTFALIGYMGLEAERMDGKITSNSFTKDTLSYAKDSYGVTGGVNLRLATLQVSYLLEKHTVNNVQDSKLTQALRFKSYLSMIPFVKISLQYTQQLPSSSSTKAIYNNYQDFGLGVGFGI